MREQYHKWYSNRIGREFEMLTFGYAGIPLLLFPTSKGTYYQCKDFGLVDTLEIFIKKGKIKVYCPDSYDKESWFNNSISPAERVQNHMLYDDFLLNEIVYQALEDTKQKKIITAGCNLGAYHAANFAFRHPDKVSYTFALSGNYDMRMFLDGYFDNNAYYNNPVDYLPNLTNEWYLEHISRMGIILSTTEQDSFKTYSFQLANILQSKHINHWLDVRNHATKDWNFWKEVLPHYVSLAIKE